jgi:23S rRNA pseudouridine1911/1915/1917 synthase
MPETSPTEQSRTDTLRIDLTPDDSGQRLDKVLARHLPTLSRTRLQALVKSGEVRLDGVEVRSPSLKLGSVGVLLVDQPPATELALKAEEIALDIVHEDDQIIVLDKPAGLVVHPGAGHADGTLVNALMAHCGDSLSGIGGVKRPGIVHRLDKDTSGLLVVAKTDAAHQSLSAQFADHGRTGPLQRAYLALVWGVPRRPAGTIRTFIDRSSTHREKMAVVPEGRGREAITHYEVLATYPAPAAPGRGRAGQAGHGPEPLAALVRCQLETGRTHQIRVHMAHLGHPVLGDDVYGSGFRTKAARLPPEAADAFAGMSRQALHAALLGFAHPVSGEELVFERDPPADFASVQEKLADL